MPSIFECHRYMVGACTILVIYLHLKIGVAQLVCGDLIVLGLQFVLYV